MKYIKRITAGLLLALSLTACSEKKNTEKPEIYHHDDDIYEIVNLLLAPHQDEPKISQCLVKELLPLTQMPDESVEIIIADSLFTGEDRTQILKQAKDTIPYIIDKKYIANDVKTISNDSLYMFRTKSENLQEFWKHIRKNYAEQIVTISKPLFSKNRQLAVVSVSFNCGALCGHGSRYILSKTENGWKIIKTTLGWIS